MADLNDFIKKTPEKVVEIEQARERMRKAEQEQREEANDVPERKTLPVERFEDIRISLDEDDFVEGLLCAENMSVIYGESNCGKTFFVLDLALHISLGWEWRGREVDQGGVIYVAAEGPSSVRKRVEAFRKHHALEEQETPFGIVPCGINLRDEDGDTDALINSIQDEAQHIQSRYGVPVRLVVIDTLSRAMAGGNENASEDMGAYVRNIDRIKLATGAHVSSIHHCGKDSSRGARGHSLLRAATDTEIEISKGEDAKFSSAKVTKQRDLPTDEEFPFSLTVVELGSNRRGKPVTSCVVTAAEQGAAKTHGPKLNTKQELAYRSLCDLMNELNRPTVAIKRFDTLMIERGVLDRDDGRGRFTELRNQLVKKGLIFIRAEEIRLVKHDQ
jgi:hypothetical protein